VFFNMGHFGWLHLSQVVLRYKPATVKWAKPGIEEPARDLLPRVLAAILTREIPPKEREVELHQEPPGFHIKT
jgi:hypothetical protein